MKFIKYYNSFRLRSLNESVNQSKVNTIYDTLAKAADPKTWNLGFGTDEEKLIEAIELIDNVETYRAVDQKMSNKPIKIGQEAYNSIEDLLNGELDPQDLKIAEKIKNLLKPIGITMSFRLIVPSIGLPPELDLNSIKITLPAQNVNTNGKNIIDELKKLVIDSEKIFTDISYKEYKGIYCWIIYKDKWHQLIIWYDKNGSPIWSIGLYLGEDDDKSVAEYILNLTDCKTGKVIKPDSKGFVNSSDNFYCLTTRCGSGGGMRVMVKNDKAYFFCIYPKGPQKPTPPDQDNNNFCKPCIYRLEGYQECAKKIQQALYDLGKEYQDILKTTKGNGVDGFYGERTCRAISIFQENNNLTPDGCWGPETAKKYKELYQKYVTPCGIEEEPQKKAQGQVQDKAQGQAQKEKTTTSPTNRAERGAEIYARLIRDGQLKKRGLGRNTIVYKGPDLDENDKLDLIEYMETTGFRISKDKYDAKPGEKIIFKRN